MEYADDEPLFADDLEGLSDEDDVPPLPPPMPSLDDFDGLPPSPPAAGDALRVEAASTGEGQPPQKKRKPILTLTNERIFSEKGILYLPKEFSKLKFQGKGNEAADLTYLLKQYEHWANRLFPKLTSVDVTNRIESLARTKEFKGHLRDLRRRWIRGSTPPIIDDDDGDDKVNGGSFGDGGNGGNGGGGGGDGGGDAGLHSDDDNDVWGDIGERPLAAERSHLTNTRDDANKENSPPSDSDAESTRPNGDSRSTEGSWKLALGTEDHHSPEGSTRPKGDSRSTEGSWKLALGTEDHHSPEGSTRPKGDSRSTEGSWKLALGTEDHHSPEGSTRPKGDSRSTEGSWKLALGTEDHHSPEGSTRPKGDSRSTEGSWKLALGTEDHRSPEGSTRPKGDSRSTEGSWKLALGTEDHHSPEGSTRPKGDSRSTEGSWKLALGTEDHHSPEGSTRPKGDSRSTEGSWKLALGTEDHHSPEGSIRPKGDGHSTEGSWKLALARDIPIGEQGKGCNSDAEELDSEDNHLSPILDSRGSWKLKLDEDAQCHGDDGGNGGPHMEDHDVVSPVLNSRRRDLRGIRHQVASSDDSEDELRLRIDEDSAKVE